MLLVYKNSTENHARREAGGKGYNLYLLAKLGLPVPYWIAVGRSVFAKFLESDGLREKIENELQKLKLSKINAVTAEKNITALITTTPLTAEINKVFDEVCAHMKTYDLVSVRSSAADEDSATHSFAGQLSSFLYIRDPKVLKLSILKCWASAFSERGLVYRLENNLDIHNIAVSVIIQQMIDPDCSGVLFTCEPTAKNLDQFVISSVYGVGEGLVSGALDADTFWLDAQDGKVLKQDIVSKTEAFKKGQNDCKTIAISHELQNLPSLKNLELYELFSLAKKIMKSFHRPQDVEWAIENGRVYLLQTRPVTTLTYNLTGYPNLWDNSNIVESYGGITLPLSFSFALRNYKNVYVQFCEILSVPPQIVKDMEYYLGNMLGSIYGRVYYNLYNWYKLVGVLPGFKQNMQFMETMMGVQERLSDEIAERIRPHPSWDTPIGKWRKFKTGLAFLTYHFTIQGIVDRYLISFGKIYDYFRKIPYMGMPSDEIFQYYILVDRKMMGEWKAPIINDFLCMVHFGIFKKLTNNWCAGLDSNIQNDLLAGDGNLESAEPTKQLIRFAGFISKNSDLKNLIENAPAKDLYEALKQSPHQEFFEMVGQYIDRFGFRCMSEMKLEEIDLNQDPTFLFVCLKNYLRSGTVDLDSYEQREKEIRKNAEVAVKKHLTGFKKILYLWSMKQARKAVRNRENTRFARTRAYGVARTMFRAMGHDLAARGILSNEEDIFYLTVEDIYGIHQGTLTATNLTMLIESRKTEYEAYKNLEPKVRFMTRGPVYWQNELEQKEEEVSMPADAYYDLAGLPCCPGIVEGVVKVVNSPTDDLNLNQEILVTPRTDPGWVPLYPSVSGLLVERGSLLSHSAIVAREMGLPAIVGIKDLTKTLKSGMRIRMDGKNGTIKIL